jgi:hypothetical protein
MHTRAHTRTVETAFLDGVIVAVGMEVGEHEPTKSAVAPALVQHGHTPEQALVASPVVAPYVPAGQGVAADEPSGQ